MNCKNDNLSMSPCKNSTSLYVLRDKMSIQNIQQPLEEII